MDQALPARLELGGAPAAWVRGQRIELALPDALLLAWLALEGPTPRERLAALLWPDSSNVSARNALRQRLFRLRRQLGVDLVAGGALLALAEGVAHDTGADGGPLLGQAGSGSRELDAWLARRRDEQAGRRRGELAVRIDALEAAGDAAAALPLAQELLQLEPLAEEAHRRVMRLHYLLGDRAGAMLAFDRCEQLLKHEVGTRPSAATLELLALIEAGGEPAPPPAAAGWRAALPASVLRPPRLIGREAERAALAQAWGAGRLVLVIGEAGIGKSRLLQTLPAGPASAGGAAAVALASARPGDTLVPYASLARLLRQVHAIAPAALAALPPALQERLAPLLPGLAPEPTTGRRGAPDEALHELLRAAAPQIDGLVLDDLHFADEASLELLTTLLTVPPPAPARHPAAAPRWCLGLRPPAPGTRLAALVEALARAGPLHVLDLLPLDEPRLAALVDSLALPGVRGAAIAPALHRRCGGNPLFALETLKGAWGEGRFDFEGGLPQAPSLLQLIGEQLARLSAPALALARVAAVAGVDFSLSLAEQVLRQDALALADPWHELEGARVLVGSEFAHDLVFEAVLAGVPAIIARALHGRVAAWLEAHGGEPARVAAHWEAAGERERALPGLREAAARAHRALREHERIEILLRAADIAEHTGHHDVAFDCLAQAVETHMNSIRQEGGFPLLDRLDALADGAAQRSRALGMRAWYLSQLPDHAAAVRVGEQALALAETLADRAASGPIRQRLATSLAMLGRFPEALAHLQAVQQWADAQLRPDDLAEFHGNFAVVLDNLGRVGDARAHHERALAHSHAIADHAQRVTHLANHAMSRLNAGDAAGAMQLVRQGEALVASYEMQGASVAFLALLHSHAARALGDYADALAAADRALALLETSNPQRRPLVWAHRAQVWLELGQHARAGQDLRAAEGVDNEPRHVAARRLLLLARWQRALGQPFAATLDAAAAAAPPDGWPNVRLAIELEHLPGGVDAVPAIERVLAEAAALGFGGLELVARLKVGLALAPHDPARAAAEARAALALGASFCPTLRPRSELWADAARALAPAAPAEARAAAEAGQRWLRETAAAQVPEPFRESFLHRAAGHAELLALRP
jgi:DNA-binding SARP family transcriptional activator